ncbi:hypothetical protein MXB_4232 [Myxobolus squamalis]|nr:hypothetical protein MXB_4232 [Myxobolus squamalis]
MAAKYRQSYIRRSTKPVIKQHPKIPDHMKSNTSNIMKFSLLLKYHVFMAISISGVTGYIFAKYVQNYLSSNHDKRLIELNEKYIF